MECKGTFSRAKDDECFVRGSVGVDEAMLRGVRERSQDAVQALGFVEALDGETGTGKGTWREEEYTMRGQFTSRTSISLRLRG